MNSRTKPKRRSVPPNTSREVCRILVTFDQRNAPETWCAVVLNLGEGNVHAHARTAVAAVRQVQAMAERDREIRRRR